MNAQDQDFSQAKQRLGLTFHRTFSLEISSLSSILALTQTQSPDNATLTLGDIRKQLNLGTIQVEAFPRYGKGTGLLDSSLQPTRFGTTVKKKDPLLDQLSTQWLMHYHLSAPHGPGPLFWHQLVTTRFRSGDEFTRDEIAEQISTIYLASEGKELADRTATTTATVFLGTYTKLDGFGKLKIIEDLGDSRYRVLEPDPPSVWAVAYALLDYWAAHFSQQITIDLNAFSGPDGLSSLFMIGSGRLNVVLRAMQESGFVEVHRVAPPYQLVLLNSDPHSLLERLYSYE